MINKAWENYIRIRDRAREERQEAINKATNKADSIYAEIEFRAWGDYCNVTREDK